ncbi:MAG: FG-GAP repeat domain-containing protein, partial [Blastocatellia bacterium]
MKEIKKYLVLISEQWDQALSRLKSLVEGWAPYTTLALYHNNHDGTFTDVTRKAGLAVEMYGMGVAIGDYNNDGYDDIFVTALGQSHLFRNNGNGTFADVTRQAGLWGPNEFSTST